MFSPPSGLNAAKLNSFKSISRFTLVLAPESSISPIIAIDSTFSFIKVDFILYLVKSSFPSMFKLKSPNRISLIVTPSITTFEFG